MSEAMNTLLTLAGAGIVWLVVASVAGVFVGRWLAWGSGQRFLDSWVED